MPTFDLTTVEVPVEGLTLDGLLGQARAAKKEPVFLKVKGRVRYALVPADDGDQEVYALRSNPAFMTYLDQLLEHAAKEPGQPIEAVARELGVPLKRPGRRERTARPKSRTVGSSRRETNGRRKRSP